GGILLMLFLTTTLILIVDLTANRSSLNFKVLLFVVALFSGISFVLNEKNKTNKLLEIALFKNKQFIKLLGAFFLLQYS
ncbi:MFS transporter, partial [Lactobacillus crispatus]|nr:MFS transporter [Lactobacillus crispatus]